MVQQLWVFVEWLEVVQVIVLVMFDLVVDFVIGKCIEGCVCYCIWFGNLFQVDEDVYGEQQWEGGYDCVQYDDCIVEGDKENDCVGKYGVSCDLCKCGIDL